MNLFFILTFFVLIVYVIAFSFYLYKREIALKKKEDEIHNNAQFILNKSNYKAEKIVEDAAMKAKEILDRTKLFKSNIEDYASEAVFESVQKYVDELEKVSHEVNESYQGLFTQLKSKYQEDEKETISKIEEVAIKQLEDFSKDMSKKTEEYQKYVEKFVEDEKNIIKQIDEKANKEITTFSDSLIQKIQTYEQNLENFIQSEKNTINQIQTLADKNIEGLSNLLTDKTKAYEEQFQKFVESEKTAATHMEELAAKGIEDFNKVITDKTAIYEENLNKFIDEEKVTITKLQDSANKGIEDFNKLIVDKTIEYQNSIQEKLKTEFEKSKADIDKYRDDEMKRIKTSVDQLVMRISTELLGKTLKSEDHEKLLLQALEDAKQESIFAI